MVPGVRPRRVVAKIPFLDFCLMKAEKDVLCCPEIPFPLPGESLLQSRHQIVLKGFGPQTARM